MAPEYQINSLADLFKVPIERRSALFRDLEYAMALQEMAYADKAAAMLGGMVWTDDDSHTVNIRTPSGKPVLSLNVTQNATTGDGAL